MSWTPSRPTVARSVKPCVRNQDIKQRAQEQRAQELFAALLEDLDAVSSGASRAWFDGTLATSLENDTVPLTTP